MTLRDLMERWAEAAPEECQQSTSGSYFYVKAPWDGDDKTFDWQIGAFIFHDQRVMPDDEDAITGTVTRAAAARNFEVLIRRTDGRWSVGFRPQDGEWETGSSKRLGNAMVGAYVKAIERLTA